jgi:polar amino acid transport system substrate-binding protein
MKHLSRILTAAMIIAMALSFAACGGGGNDGDSILRTAGTLTIGADIGYPPMEYYDVDGTTPIGFDIDVGKAIAELLGLEYRVVDTAWDGIFAGVERGDYDAIISSVSITPARQEVYLFTKPYIANALCIVVPKGTDAIKSPADFEGMRIAVQDETTADISVSEMVDDGMNINVSRYPQVINCFDDLRVGRVDAVYVDSVVAAFYTTGSDEFYRIWISPEDEPLGICLAKDSVELRDAICAAVDMLYYNGKIAEIGRKHFGDDFVPARTVTSEPTIPIVR